MKLDKKKALAAKVLKVGKKRINFDVSRLEEIKEAITKQDIRDLFESGTIKIKAIMGGRKKEKRKTRKRHGKIKKSVKKRKEEYVKITRKLRKYCLELKKQGRVDNENYRDLRKKIKARNFKSQAQMKEYVKEKIQ